MAATVAWIGGLFFQAVVLPNSFSRNLGIDQQAKLMESIRKRFEPIAWLSLFILIGTGLTQMTANPQYEGFLSISNQWASAILIKHIAIAFMVIVAGAQTWVIQPRLIRHLIRLAQSKANSDEIKQTLNRQKALTQVNMILSLIVLALTAVARSS
jgi:uncharacterized membrane protein